MLKHDESSSAQSSCFILGTSNQSIHHSETHPSIYLSVHLSVNPSISQSIRPSTHPSVNRFHTRSLDWIDSQIDKESADKTLSQFPLLFTNSQRSRTRWTSSSHTPYGSWLSCSPRFSIIYKWWPITSRGSSGERRSSVRVGHTYAVAVITWPH